MQRDLNRRARQIDREMNRADRLASREMNRADREFGTSQKASKNFTAGLGIATNLMNTYGSQDYDSLQKGVKSGISSGLVMSGNPVLMGVGVGLSALDALGEGLNINNQNISKPAAEQLDISKGSMVGNYITNMIPGLSFLGGLGTEYKGVGSINDINKAAISYNKTVNDSNAFSQLNKGRYLFGGKEINQKSNKHNEEIGKINSILNESKKMESNYAPQFLGINNTLAFQGIKPELSFRKKGGTIPELDEVRSIMQSLQSKKQEIQEPQKFQLGGKMNMIVTGALHARKHNLEELNPNLEGEITKKGIPVVVMNEGGEVKSQQAEVETGEIIMQIDATKTIEDYYDEYNSTNSKTEKNRIALECGKYLVNELLKNTDDPDKLIKKTV